MPDCPSFRGRAVYPLVGLLLALVACQGAAAPAPAKPTAASAPSGGAAAPAGGSAAATSAPSQPAAASAPAAGASPGQLEAVKLFDVRAVAAGPVYIAMDKGYFREQGLEVQLESGAGAAEAVPFLATGDLDLASGAISVGLFNAFDRGADIRIIAPSGILPLEDSPLPLMVRKDLVDSAEVRTAADLRGRRIAMNTRGAVVEYLLSKTLEAVGMTIHDVDLVTMPFPDMPAALSNGSIDACVAAEPAATRAASLGVGVKLVKEMAPGKASTVIIASGKLLRERPEVARRWMIGYMKGTREVQPPTLGTFDPERFYRPDILAILEKYTGAPERVLRDQVPYTWDVDLVIQGDTIMDQQLTHMRDGTLTLAQPIPLERMIDEGFVRHAQQALGRLRQ